MKLSSKAHHLMGLFVFGEMVRWREMAIFSHLTGYNPRHVWLAAIR